MTDDDARTQAARAAAHLARHAQMQHVGRDIAAYVRTLSIGEAVATAAGCTATVAEMLERAAEVPVNEVLLAEWSLYLVTASGAMQHAAQRIAESGIEPGQVVEQDPADLDPEFSGGVAQFLAVRLPRYQHALLGCTACGDPSAPPHSVDADDDAPST